MKMKFVFEKLLTGRGNVVCADGLFDAALQISHWPDNDTPYELKADTTTEMAFKLIESGRKDSYLKGIEIVSNNHFDADGLISAFVLVYPEKALEIKNELTNTAIFGDFAEFNDEDSLKAACVIESMMDMDNGMFSKELQGIKYPQMMQFLYEKGFELLPDIIADPDKYSRYWKSEFDHYKRSEESFISQASVFSNYGDCYLSVIESSMPLHRAAKYNHAAHDIVLSAVKTKEGNLYEMEYKLYTWFETKRKPQVERKEFNGLADILNGMENSGKGKWRVPGKDPISDWDYRLMFTDDDYRPAASSLAIYEVENILFENL